MVNASSVKVADQVWIAVALLHREQPERLGFTATEIIGKVRAEFASARPGISVHIYLDPVAPLAPNPGRYRILSPVGDKQYRLFRAGDHYHPEREGGKIQPSPQDLPPKFRELLEWYRGYSRQHPGFTEDDPLFEIMGKWGSQHTDLSIYHDKHLADIYEEELRRGSPPERD